jgi:hypothetical protein
MLARISENSAKDRCDQAHWADNMSMLQHRTSLRPPEHACALLTFFCCQSSRNPRAGSLPQALPWSSQTTVPGPIGESSFLTSVCLSAAPSPSPLLKRCIMRKTCSSSCLVSGMPD